MPLCYCSVGDNGNDLPSDVRIPLPTSLPFVMRTRLTMSLPLQARKASPSALHSVVEPHVYIEHPLPVELADLSADTTSVALSFHNASSDRCNILE